MGDRLLIETPLTLGVLPHVVLFGFVRLATSARVFVSPMSPEESLGCVLAWLEPSHVIEVEGGPDHVNAVFELLRQAGGGGGLTTDAQIAAAAVHHRATVFTNDTDFQRFPGLSTENPLRRTRGGMISAVES